MDYLHKSIIYLIHTEVSKGFLQTISGWLNGKESACNAGDTGNIGSDPWFRKIPWRRGQPTPVFLPGESHGQKSLAGSSPWGHKELDTTEYTDFSNEIRKHQHIGGLTKKQ